MKKTIALVIAVVLVLTLSGTAFAAVAAPYRSVGAGAYGYGYCGGGNSFMWDADGNRLSRADAEAKLDQYIADGIILEADKEYYLQMYDYCVENGITAPGTGLGRRGGRGMGGGGCCRLR